MKKLLVFGEVLFDLFEEKAEMTYNLIMTQLLDTEEYDD